MNDTIKAADGTDLVRRVDGRAWRVRVRVHSEIAADAPINGEHDVEPSGYGVVLSVAALDEGGEVVKSPSGRLLVFAPHVVTFQREALAMDSFDPQTLLDDLIDAQIELAERELGGKAKLASALVDFGAHAPNSSNEKE
jgi:hypothetical protein